MCGILGISIPKVTAKDIILFENILRELRIRGLHATGISWLEDSVIRTIKEPIGADRFLEKHSLADCVESDMSLNLIAHTRYSTSDLRYNQPITDSTLSVVHNGVISQELPENWPRLYGAIGVCETSNDTELLFNTSKEGKSTLVEWQNSSLAVIELVMTLYGGILRAYRNGRRPLYMLPYANGYIFTSTADALKRAGLNEQPDLLPSNCYINIREYERQVQPAYIQGAVDLQRV